jgi:hypothetical protein
MSHRGPSGNERTAVFENIGRQLHIFSDRFTGGKLYFEVGGCYGCLLVNKRRRRSNNRKSFWGLRGSNCKLSAFERNLQGSVENYLLLETYPRSDMPRYLLVDCTGNPGSTSNDNGAFLA